MGVETRRDITISFSKFFIHIQFHLLLQPKEKVKPKLELKINDELPFVRLFPYLPWLLQLIHFASQALKDPLQFD